MLTQKKARNYYRANNAKLLRNRLSGEHSNNVLNPRSLYQIEDEIMFLAIKMIHGMAREISKRVNYLKNECPYPCQPAKRVALRCFAELVLGSIHGLIAGKLKDGFSLHECSQDEKALIKELRKCRAEIHSMLASVGCDIADVDN
ncbi:hypothetical protein D7D44_07455 [Escherichia coli]|nr:hypothetical protein [Escherichia coli]